MSEFQRYEAHTTLEPTAYPPLTPYPAKPDEPMTHAVDREHRRTEPRFNKALKRAGAGALIAVGICAKLLVNDIEQGIHDGKEEVRDDHASIHEIYDYTEANPLYRNHATFVMTGLGTKDPSKTARALTAHQARGDVYGIEYGNSDLNTEEMARQVIETATTHDIRYLSLDGQSAGGPILLDIAAYIYKHEPSLHIISVTMNSSPLGKDSLSDRSIEGIDAMDALLSIDEDLVYYKQGREGVELFNRHERYKSPEYCTDDKPLSHSGNIAINALAGQLCEINAEHLVYDIKDVHQKVNNPGLAGGKLIRDQAQFCTNIKYRRNLETLSKKRPGDITLPIIIYTRARNSRDDDVVNVDKGEANFYAAVREFGNPHAVVHADVGHANPLEKPEVYNRIINDEVFPLIAKPLVLYAIKHEMERTPKTYTNALGSTDAPTGN